VEPRRELEWVLPVTGVLTSAAVAVAFAGELPDPIATRWTPSGNPDAASGRFGELTIGTLVIAFFALMPVAMADRATGIGPRRTMVVVGHVLTTFGTGHRLRTVTANQAADHWTDATVGLPVMPIVFTAVAAGLAGWWLSGHRREPPRNHGDEDEPGGTAGGR
jgi:uncharacterized membrane protein